MKNILRNSNFGFTKWCFALIATLMTFATTGLGQVSITGATIISEDFTGYAGTSTVPINWDLSGTGTSYGFRGTAAATGTSGGWYGNGNMSFLGSGNAANGRATWKLQNNTGTTVTGFSLQYVARLWKTGTASPIVKVYYLVSTSSTFPAASESGWTELTALAFNDATASITTGASMTASNISASIPNGNYLYIRWFHPGGSSSDNLGWASIRLTPTVAATSPAITLNPATPTLSAFTTTAGTASTAQTFAVTGSNLTADVTVTAPAGFEVSKDGTNYASSQILTQSAGVVASTTISVRIAASTVAGSLASANVTLTSTGATPANVAVSGTVAQAGVAPTVTAATIPGTFRVALSANVVASENPTSYAITSGTLPDGLSLDPTTGAITGTPTAAGTGVVVAVTASNATGTSAPANLTFDIAKGGQTISGLSTADSKYTTAPSYPLTATASSGLAVTYTSSDEAVATISDSTVTIVGAGTTTITASQAGDNNYNAATNVTQSLTVTVPPMVAWEVSGLTGGSNNFGPTVLDGTYITNLNPNLTVVGLTRGSGILTTGTGASKGWGGTDFMATTVAAAVTASDFVTFSITPKSGYQASFSQIPAYNIRRSGSGPTTGIWQYQKGSAAFIDIGTPITWGGTTSSTGNTQLPIDLSVINGLQNVPAGTTVTFRLVAWGATGSGGTFYLNDITGNDLAVMGTVSEYTADVPSLSSFTPAFGATGSTVTISGSNLSAVTGVKFNGQAAVFAIQSSSQITATVPAELRAGKISLIYGSPEAEVLSNTNFEPLDGGGLATVVNGDGASPYVNTAIFAKGQSDNQTLAVTVSNPIVNSAISTVRITLPSDFPLPSSPSFSLSGAGAVSVSGRALTVEGAVVTSDSPLTVTITGLSTPDTSVNTALDGNYGITVETAGAGGTLANVLVAPTAYVLVPIINLRGVDANGVPTQAGKKVAFEGVVTASGLGSKAGRTKAYVQDPSAAIYIYSAAFTSAPTQGNVYAALGTLTQFRGGTQIDPGTASNLIDRGAGVLPEPTVLTLPISTTVGERYEGSLVKIVGLSRATGEVDLWETSATITLQDSALATVDLFLQPDSKNSDQSKNETTEPANYPATVVGILGQYDQESPFITGYQLQPRAQADLIVNTAPTEITLSSASFPENNPPNLVVGTLTTTDDNATGATYTFATGTGDADNGAFNISGDSLRATNPLDFEAKPSSTYSVLIQVTDAGGLTFTQQFTITVTDVNETPADTTPPVITLIGANPLLIANGATYADPGATVTDNVDATRTIQGTGTVNTAAAGDYTITYNATDAANNAATQVTRTVRVAGTYADWSGGSTLDSAGLAKYAIGGASSLTANDGVKPTTTLTGEFLVITAIVRTDNSRLAVVAQAVTDLANYASGTGVTTVNGVETTDQTGVPTGHKRKTFSVARDGDARKFMRLSASLALSGTNTTVSVARDSGGATFLQVTGATAGSTSGGSATSDKRTIYYYANDTTSSPTFFGPAWPYVMVQGQLSAGTGVTATLTKNSSGMLLVNGLPAYQYVGDSGSTTANGVGGTWPGMKADGTKTTTAPGGTIQ